MYINGQKFGIAQMGTKINNIWQVWIERTDVFLKSTMHLQIVSKDIYISIFFFFFFKVKTTFNFT